MSQTADTDQDSGAQQQRSGQERDLGSRSERVVDLSKAELVARSDSITRRLRDKFDPEFQRTLSNRVITELRGEGCCGDTINLAARLLIRAPVRTEEVERVAEALLQSDLTLVQESHRKVKTISALRRLGAEHPQEEAVLGEARQKLLQTGEEGRHERKKIRIHLRSYAQRVDQNRDRGPSLRPERQARKEFKRFFDEKMQGGGDFGAKEFAKKFTAALAEESLQEHSAAFFGRALKIAREKLPFVAPKDASLMLREMARSRLIDPESLDLLLDAALATDPKTVKGPDFADRVRAVESYLLGCARGEHFNPEQAIKALDEAKEETRSYRSRARITAFASTLLAVGDAAQHEDFKKVLKEHLHDTFENFDRYPRLHERDIHSAELERLTLGARILDIEPPRDMVSSLTTRSYNYFQEQSDLEKKVMETLEPLTSDYSFTPQGRVEKFPWMYVDFLVASHADRQLTVLEVDGPSHSVWNVDGEREAKRGLDRLREMALKQTGVPVLRINAAEFNYVDADTLVNHVRLELSYNSEAPPKEEAAEDEAAALGQVGPAAPDVLGKVV